MATTLAGVSFSPTRVVAKADSPPKTHTFKPLCLNLHPWRVNHFKGARINVRTMATAPESLSESIKEAQETCAENPVSGECAAAWDTVEEISATKSDQRLKKKETDPLEEYCKDNPETKECRTFDD